MDLSEDSGLQPILFGLFLSMYLVTVLGNLLIILAVSSDSHLHTPMYFFLSNLSLIDICFTSTTVPKMLVNIQIHSRTISYMGCLTQMSLFVFFACMESLLLTAMAYDRFVAICHPLHYQIIMNPHFCGFLVFLSLWFSLLDSQLHNLIALHFGYFKDVEISNFFCDPSQIFNLACPETFTKNMVRKLVSATVFISSLRTESDPSLGARKFNCIGFSFLGNDAGEKQPTPIPSSGGKHKTFSTCGSHLSVVCLFYGTGVAVYLASAVSQSPSKVAVSSMMYTVVIPMLNPFIYSLKNEDIKSALRRLHSRIVKSQNLWHPFEM
ncbi:Olfactory receptor 7E24 [Sciurus carolinensis]|uniref:Olfactory receptor n=1 Tax=Sciurus carolinensis TaxID=30640 RepID=A0AA41NA88_SCICA|nr:Olfactory receptor 7E24 [Sciurus carolinensis]